MSEYKVIAEMRAEFTVGTFDAASPQDAMKLAQETRRYHALSQMPNMGGVYDLFATDGDNRWHIVEVQS